MKIHCLIFLVSYLALTTSMRMPRAGNTPDLTPTIGNKLGVYSNLQSCKLPNGRSGKCFHESMCTEDHVFHSGGVIDPSEIKKKAGRIMNLLQAITATDELPNATRKRRRWRAVQSGEPSNGGQATGNITSDNCHASMYWCCEVPSAATTATPPKSTDEKNIAESECTTGANNSCPWCVGLYRDGGHPNKKASGRYCGAAVIEPRTVLTSATCLLAGRGSNLWVQFPGSDTRYTVSDTIKNPNFNSGTRQNDAALLKLNEDIPWPEREAGDCLRLETPLVGDCVAIGFDKDDKLTFTPVSVTAGSCSQRGAAPDAACGRAKDVCSVDLGSPVLCPSTRKGEGLVIAGMVRQVCMSNTTRLGSLVQSAAWVREEISKIATETRATIKK